MKEKLSALRSKYIIDGIQQELTPAQMLESVSGVHGQALSQEDTAIPGRIVDESCSPGPSSFETDPVKVDKYLTRVLAAKKLPSMVFAAEFTRARIEQALIDCIWRVGHFSLVDLGIDAKWSWNDRKIGNMAALYSSVSAATEFADALGIGIRNYSESIGDCNLDIQADLRPGAGEESLVEQPFGSEKPRIGPASISSVLNPDPASWVVYIPFDTSSYRLGGSLLAQVLKASPAVAPTVNDPDYFIDCYEVVRELVEDGILLSATTVCEGGLLAALKSMTTPRIGVEADLSDLRRAMSEDDPVRLLFSEVPGALVQIRDIDFDYLDAELLLQDIAFYPLGHPVPGGNVKLHSSERSGIQNILESLIRSQGSEGED